MIALKAFQWVPVDFKCQCVSRRDYAFLLLFVEIFGVFDTWF